MSKNVKLVTLSVAVVAGLLVAYWGGIKPPQSPSRPQTSHKSHPIRQYWRKPHSRKPAVNRPHHKNPLLTQGT